MMAQGRGSLRRTVAWARCRLRGDQASMSLWVAVTLAGILLVFGGLVYDGAGVATRQSELIDAAWSLARTGAAQTVVDAGSLQIDVDAALYAINVAASRQWPSMTVEAVVTETEVTVTTIGSFETSLLAAIGVDTWDLEASRTAEMIDPARASGT